MERYEGQNCNDYGKKRKAMELVRKRVNLRMKIKKRKTKERETREG